MSELTAAQILFPVEAAAEAKAAAAPVARPAAAPVAQPAQPAAAPAEESLDARIERLFGDPNKVADPAEAAKPAADPAALPDFIDTNNPDSSLAIPVVQELGLGREQVARLETLHNQMTAAAIERQTATWAAEAAKLDQSVIRDAQTAVSQFGTPELKAVLNRSGLGNHPAIIAAFARAYRSNPFRGGF
jgi:hypothetical protein